MTHAINVDNFMWTAVITREAVTVDDTCHKCREVYVTSVIHIGKIRVWRWNNEKQKRNIQKMIKYQ